VESSLVSLVEHPDDAAKAKQTSPTRANLVNRFMKSVSAKPSAGIAIRLV
jgi:hypothetical protein